MSKFDICIKLPSGKSIRVPELTNRVHFNIIKYCENRDYEGLNELFNRELFLDNSIDIIDRFYLCVYIRAVYVDPYIVLDTDDKLTRKYDLDILLANIKSVYDDFTNVVSCGGINMTLGLPTTLYFNTIDDLYVSTIKQLNIANTTIEVDTLPLTEKEELMSKLPQDLFKPIVNYIENISAALSRITILNNTHENSKEYEINILSNNSISFIAMLYNTGLNNFYNTLYSFCTSINNTSQFFFDITPVETRVIINIHNTRIEQQNKE